MRLTNSDLPSSIGHAVEPRGSILYYTTKKQRNKLSTILAWCTDTLTEVRTRTVTVPLRQTLLLIV